MNTATAMTVQKDHNTRVAIRDLKPHRDQDVRGGIVVTKDLDCSSVG